MLSRSQRRDPSVCLFSAKWWLCLWTAMLFAFYVHYLPAHLATATHVDDAIAKVFDSVLHLHGHSHDAAEVPSDRPGDSHSPHPASDHVLTLATQSQTAAVTLLSVCVPTETLFQFHAPEIIWKSLVIERLKPPGESPPDPSQPRAPPIV